MSVVGGKQKRIEVDLEAVCGCFECIFTAEEYDHCNAADRYFDRNGPTPRWCPLRKGSVLVVAKGGEQ